MEFELWAFGDSVFEAFEYVLGLDTTFDNAIEVKQLAFIIGVDSNCVYHGKIVCFMQKEALKYTQSIFFAARTRLTTENTTEDTQNFWSTFSTQEIRRRKFVEWCVTCLPEEDPRITWNL